MSPESNNRASGASARACLTSVAILTSPEIDRFIRVIIPGLDPAVQVRGAEKCDRNALRLRRRGAPGGGKPDERGADERGRRRRGCPSKEAGERTIPRVFSWLNSYVLRSAGFIAPLASGEYILVQTKSAKHSSRNAVAPRDLNSRPSRSRVLLAFVGLSCKLLNTGS